MCGNHVLQCKKQQQQENMSPFCLCGIIKVFLRTQQSYLSRNGDITPCFSQNIHFSHLERISGIVTQLPMPINQKMENAGEFESLCCIGRLESAATIGVRWLEFFPSVKFKDATVD